MKITRYLRQCCRLIVVVQLMSGQNVLARNLPDFTPLVEKHSPAVVNISTRKSVAEGPGLNMPEIPEDSPFFDFFNKYFGQQPPGNRQPFGERSSLGSGFIISRDGYVITNNHVVENADEIIVGLKDRRELVAELVGTDKRSDIALLKIDAKDLPTLKLGDSSKLKAGEWVLAIGSPFGFNHSVTAGIVSAMGRSLPNENYIPFIQTDVAINPGNSGGPLFNLDGEVIGVNSQIFSRTGGFMGLSFAVPIDVVANVYRQLKENGSVDRGWLGVLIQEVTRELAESFAMEKPHGALVVKVLPDSPAAKAGLEVGDIVVRFDGREIGFRSDLPPMVGNSQIGSSVPLQIIRRGKKQKVRVTIEKLPEENQVRNAASSKPEPEPSNRLGIVVRPPSEEEEEGMQLSGYGVLVEKVNEGVASEAGIRPGDVLLLINNTKVTSPAKMEEILEELPADRSIPILIQRRGNPIFLALKLQKDS